MKSLFATSLLGLFISVHLVGCGSSSSNGNDAGTGGSGVSGSKTLASLTVAEKNQLCDWQAGLDGGYGKTMMCASGGTASNSADQAECVADVPSCPVTVAQLETCVKVVAAVPLCEQLAKLLTAPECQPLGACL